MSETMPAPEGVYRHKELVKQIAGLPWQDADPRDIILLSLATAKEFASSLRAGVELYPEDSRMMEMVSGELETDNMTFDDYVSKGDHWQFLDHFVKKYSIASSKPEVEAASQEYVHAVETLSPADRAMTVFSREEELTSIFEKVVAAHDWEKLGYGFYLYYLKQHIFFDSGDGGHHHLTQHFPLHPEILEKFYQERLKMYQSLFDKGTSRT
ncbi:MAG: hypothetical protein WDN10_03030 [bacterium]